MNGGVIMNLWKDFETWKEECCWVDLTRPLSPATPHWDGFPEMIIKDLYDYAEDGSRRRSWKYVLSSEHMSILLHIFIRGPKHWTAYTGADGNASVCDRYY